MCTLISLVKCTRDNTSSLIIIVFGRSNYGITITYYPFTHSGKSAAIRESNHGSGVCKEHYA